MGVEVLTELGGRLRTLGNRARVLEESLFAFAATVSDMPISCCDRPLERQIS